MPPLGNLLHAPLENSPVHAELRHSVEELNHLSSTT
jgi:hypothetical protein